MDRPAKLIDLTYILHRIIKNVHVTYKKTLKTYNKKNYWNQNYAWPDNYEVSETCPVTNNFLKKCYVTQLPAKPLLPHWNWGAEIYTYCKMVREQLDLIF